MVMVVLLSSHAYGSASWYTSDETGTYTIGEVHVDVTAENAVQARDEGIEQGHVQAFTALAERILAPSEFERLKVPDFDVIQPMVTGFQINNEQLSDKRYIASMALRFNPNKVTRYFAKKNAPPSQKNATTVTMIDNVTSHRVSGDRDLSNKSKSVLVLPFYQNQLNSMLWEQSNPWRTAWFNVAPQNNNQAVGDGFANIFKTAHGYYGLPKGDDSDRETITNLASISTNRDALVAMGKRYDAPYVIAPVYMAENLGQPPRLFIFGYDATSLTASPHDMNETITLYNRETYKQAIRFVTDRADQLLQTLPTNMGTAMSSAIYPDRDVQENNSTTAENENIVRISFPFTELVDWVTLSTILSNLPMVDRMAIATLKPGMAEIDLALLTNLDDLKQSLRTNEYILQDFGNGVYRITKMGQY